MRTLFHAVGAIMLAGFLDRPAAAQNPDSNATHRLMVENGFTPIDDMIFGDRDVRRVLPIDPYGILPIPGIELERHHDGRLTLRTQYRHWTGTTYIISPEEWRRLAPLEIAAFAPDQNKRTKPAANALAHCWSGAVEASSPRASRFWHCSDESRAAQAYAEAALTLAMEKNNCPASDKGLFWRYADCFKDRGTIADPGAQRWLAGLVDRWTKIRAPVADLLAAARGSLQEAAAAPTPERVSAARGAVMAFGRQKRALTAVLTDSASSSRDDEARDDRSRAIISQTRKEWKDDIANTDHLYVELLEDLTKVLSDPRAKAS